MRIAIFLSSMLLAGSAWAQSLGSWFPCTPDLCGGFAQNAAKFNVSGGEVSISPYFVGQLNVNLYSLSYDIAFLHRVGYKTLQVYYGTLYQHTSDVTYLGTITTDYHGNYNGPVWGPGSQPVSFGRGTKLTGRFYLNDPSVPNTQFVTVRYLY